MVEVLEQGAVEVWMPRLSDSMQEGTIAQWLAADGDLVQPGQEIAEIETDKATMPYEAEAAGVLRILVPAGAPVPVGGVIAKIQPAATPGQGPPAAPRPADRKLPSPRRGRAIGSVSPVAQRLAAKLGVELAQVSGTGPRGRVLKRDVRRAADAAVAPLPTAAPPSPRTQEPAPQEHAARGEELTRVQASIARRMATAKATIPEFSVEIDVPMDAIHQLRDQLAQHADPRPSLNDLLIKATALALGKHPRLNAGYRDGKIEWHDQINIGMAVASADSLLVPVIHDANSTPIHELATRTRALAARARSGALTPPEVAGATFTISNLGMLGVRRFAAIINPPQAAILAVGAVGRRPAVNADGELIVRAEATIGLVCDHRIVYGAHAAEFLQTLRGLMEHPLALLLTAPRGEA